MRFSATTIIARSWFSLAALWLAACGGAGAGRRSTAPADTGQTAGVTAGDRAMAAAGSAQATASPPASPADTPVVLFLGNSLTAGLGVRPDQAFPALIQQKIDSAGLDFRVRNAGVSGATSADGLRRIDWVLQGPVQVLVLELGANDALRGLDPAAMKRNLQAIIDHARRYNPRMAIVLAGMLAPPNLGKDYTRRYDAVFPALARESHTALVPFLLQGVAGIPSLNQADGIHPTPAGHRIVAANVWRVLAPVLRRLAARRHARSPQPR